MDSAKILDGVDLVDRELDSLTALKAETEAELAGLAAREEALQARLAEVSAKQEEVASRPTVSARALAVIAAMEAVGCDEVACRAAIVAQFGKVQPKAATKALKPPSAKGTAEKLITSGLPSADIQAEILAAVQNAGLSGIRMETLHDQFALKNVEATAVFSVIKNARLQGNVSRDGTTRGVRYYWVTKAASAPVVEVEAAPAE